MALLSGVMNRLLPAQQSGTATNARVDTYGNLFTIEGSEPIGAAYEGSLFVARHAPAVGGTGVALNIATTFVDTTPALVLTNLDAAKYYIPLYIRARITAAGSSSTSAEISAEVDNTDRYTSGGTDLTTTIACTNPGNTVASKAKLRVGAITAAAAGSQRRFVGAAVVKIAASPLWLVQDVVTLSFGGRPAFPQSAAVIASDAATPTVNSHVGFAACAIPPSGSLVLNWANIANASTAPSVEFEMAWVER